MKCVMFQKTWALTQIGTQPMAETLPGELVLADVTLLRTLLKYFKHHLLFKLHHSFNINVAYILGTSFYDNATIFART